MSRRCISMGAALVLALGVWLAGGGPARAQAALASTESAAAPAVTGIGGLFFRARDPAGLAGWYATHLGIDPMPASYDDAPWQQAAGPTVFAPFEQSTGYFGDPNQQWMINFRVTNLTGLVARLRAAGVAVEVDPESYPNGRFARLADPEGNPIQLWEPAADAPAASDGP